MASFKPSPMQCVCMKAAIITMWLWVWLNHYSYCLTYHIIHESVHQQQHYSLPSGSKASIGWPAEVWLPGPVMYLVFTNVPISCANSSCDMHFKICTHQTNPTFTELTTMTVQYVSVMPTNTWVLDTTLQYIPYKSISKLKLNAYFHPRLSKIIAISMCHGNQGLDSINILCFHFGDGWRSRKQREPWQGLNVSITLQLKHSRQMINVHTL